jgi:hypothetical protein
MIFHVYVIGPVEGFPVKIGVAAKPDQRRIELQTGCWEKLYLHHMFVADDRGAAYRLERMCHKRMAGHAMSGEWFRVFAKDACSVLDELCKEMRCGRRINNKGAHEENMEYLEKLEQWGYA